MLGGVVAAFLVLLAAGWFFFLRDNGSDDASGGDVEPSIAAETTVSGDGTDTGDDTGSSDEAATTAPESTVDTTAALPPKPTIAPGERLPELEFNGSGDSNLSIDPPGPRVATMQYSGSGPFEVTGLDANGNEVATFVSADGPYNGSVAVDFPDDQDSRSLRVTAEGPWTIRMVPVESLTPMPGVLTGSGDDVLLYTGGVGPVTVSHSGAGPIEVNYFEITTRKISTIVEETGAIERSVELRGPAFVWVEADGDWSMTPG